jgi:hypothetical protein
MINNFTKFYNVTFPKRGLSFSFINSICEIERKFNGNKYCFVVNTLQASILLLFNQIGTNSEISVATLLQVLNMKEEDFKLSIIPLVKFIV